MRRVRDQPALLVLDQEVEQELRGLLHDGVGLAQERPILAEGVVLEEVGREPRGAHRPEAPTGAVDGGRRTPEVGVVVGDEAARPVVGPRRPSARLAQLLDQVEERLVALREVRHLGRPVVHLGVDVDRVLAAPGRVHLVVPEALEVRRLGARTRAGDEQVAPVLEVGRGEARVDRSRAHGREALVRGQRVPFRRAEIQADAPEERAVVGQVAGEQLARRDASAQRLGAGGLGVSSLEARGRGQAQGHGLGVDDVQSLLVDLHSAALCLGRDLDREREPFSVPASLEAAGELEVVVGLRQVSAPAPGHEQAARRQRTHGKRLLAVQGDQEAELRRAVGGQADDDRLIRRAREDLAGEGGVADPVANADDGAVEVQLAAVVRRMLVALHHEPQIAQRLIRLQVARPAHELLVGEVLGFLVAAIADELPHRRQVLERLAVDRVVRPAGPEGILVQLDALGGHSPEDHAAQSAVADGQRLDPLSRGLPVEEDRPPRVVLRGNGLRLRSDKPEGPAGDQDMAASHRDPLL